MYEEHFKVGMCNTCLKNLKNFAQSFVSCKYLLLDSKQTKADEMIISSVSFKANLKIMQSTLQVRYAIGKYNLVSGFDVYGHEIIDNYILKFENGRLSI